jgi:putative transcriptional regulator
MKAAFIRVLFCLVPLSTVAAQAVDSTGLPPGPYPGRAEIGPGTFLVASRQLRDFHFGASVVLIYEHDRNGSVGTIINRETTIGVAEALPEIEELARRTEHLFMGGPVEVRTVRILVRSTTPLAQGEPLFADVYYLDELDVLRELAADSTLVMRFYAGYAGWGPSQLENEIRRGDWYVIPGDAELLFGADMEAVWPALIKRVSGLWTLR